MRTPTPAEQPLELMQDDDVEVLPGGNLRLLESHWTIGVPMSLSEPYGVRVAMFGFVLAVVCKNFVQ